MSAAEVTERLIFAADRIPFVQIDLTGCGFDDGPAIDAWRDYLRSHGVWARKPVPPFPYPGSPDYARIWGQPDDLAWERAHEYYLHLYSKFSGVQEARPAPLAELEQAA